MASKKDELNDMLNGSVIETCACGKEVSVKQGAKAFYCPNCGNSQLTGGNPGFKMQDTDIAFSKITKTN